MTYRIVKITRNDGNIFFDVEKLFTSGSWCYLDSFSTLKEASELIEAKKGCLVKKSEVVYSDLWEADGKDPLYEGGFLFTDELWPHQILWKAICSFFSKF